MPIRSTVVEQIHIRGLEELKKRLEQLPDEIQRKVARDGMIKALRPAYHRAEATAPEYTGELKQSFRIVALPKRDWLDANTPAVALRNFAPHAHLIEWGHRMVGHEPGKEDLRRFVPGKTFLFNALLASHSEVIDGLASEIDASIDRWARREAGKIRKAGGGE